MPRGHYGVTTVRMLLITADLVVQFAVGFLFNVSYWFCGEGFDLEQMIDNVYLKF